MIQVGAAETLLDDAIRLAKVAGAADVHVELQIWPEMVHVWPLFHPELKAGRQAIAEWERENGPLTEAELADGLARARSSLCRAPAPAAERKSA